MYLDNASTTPITKEVKEYIISLLDIYGNPSSHHSIGDKSKQILEQSRKNVAKFINADVENIIFTSSGSASNTLAIKGYMQKNNCCILYSPIAHKSILKCVKSCKYAYPLKVDKYGNVDINDLKEWFDTSEIKPFIIIDYANSEIGTIQNIKSIIDLVHFYNGTVLLDCTGSIPTVPLDVKDLNVDLVSFSSHKLGALKGCGVLYKKPTIELETLVYGSQEGGLFAGTENVLGVASLSKAIENYDYSSISSENRDYVYNYILNNIPDSYLVGVPIGENRLPHNLYMCFKGIQGESLMILLDMNGIQCSTGSACTSGSLQPSTTLTAIGMNEDDMNSCIRLSFSGNETREELDYVCKKLKECVEHLRCFSR